VKVAQIELKNDNITLPSLDGFVAFTKLKDISNKKFKSFEFKPHKNILLNNEPVGNIPMHLVGNLYNPSVVCEEYDFKKPYLEAMKLKRGDQQMEFVPKTEDAAFKPSKYFTDTAYSTNMFLKGSTSKELSDFCTETENYVPTTIEYSYKYFHTIEKPRFFGPKTLNIAEDWKIYYISPLCLVAEITINCTGFMLMDTFHTVYRYIWDSDLVFDDKKKKFGYDTKVTVEVEIVITKESYMSGTIASQGLEDHTSTLKDKIYPELKNVLSRQANKFYEGVFAAEHKVPEKKVTPNRLPELRSSSLQDDLKGLLSPLLCLFLCLLYLVACFTSTNSFLYMVMIFNIIGLALIFKKMDRLGERIERVERVLNN
jgi:hypothetical protein